MALVQSKSIDGFFLKNGQFQLFFTDKNRLAFRFSQSADFWANKLAQKNIFGVTIQTLQRRESHLAFLSAINKSKLDILKIPLMDWS